MVEAKIVVYPNERYLFTLRNCYGVKKLCSSVIEKKQCVGSNLNDFEFS